MHPISSHALTLTGKQHKAHNLFLMRYKSEEFRQVALMAKTIKNAIGTVTPFRFHVWCWSMLSKFNTTLVPLNIMFHVALFCIILKFT